MKLSWRMEIVPDSSLRHALIAGIRPLHKHNQRFLSAGFGQMNKSTVSKRPGRFQKLI
jgi:hypothetical protein